MCTMSKQVNTSDSEREEILPFLLTKVDIKNEHSGLCSGAIEEAAKNFAVHRNTIGRIWRKARGATLSQEVADSNCC